MHVQSTSHSTHNQSQLRHLRAAAGHTPTGALQRSDCMCCGWTNAFGEFQAVSGSFRQLEAPCMVHALEDV